MGSKNTAIDKADYEKTWASHAARSNLIQSERTLWNSSRYTVRPYIYFDKILVAWTVKNGKPMVKDIFTVTGVDVSLSEGIWVTMRAKVAGKDVTFTHTPRKLLDLEIFAWVPFFNELRFVSADWEDPAAPRNMRLAACFKMRSEPPIRGAHLTEGEDYLSELHVFRERFPEYSDVRF